MKLKPKLHNHPTSKLLYAFFTLLLVVSSCKKELYVQERLNPVLQQKNLEYKNGPQITTININQFKSKVNQTALGNLKKAFNISDAPKRLMTLNVPEAFSGFTVETDSIKMIVAKGHTSYVFPVKLNSNRAITFQNLTIDESEAGTFAFITTYTPTKAWIMAWKNGRQEKFDGLIGLTPLNLENNTTSVPDKSSVLKGQKLSSLQPIPKTAVTQICYDVTYYYSVPYKCASGQHNPGEECGLSGSDRAGYANISSTITTCYDVYIPSVGSGGNGGGGTAPTPPKDYNPCDELPTVSFHGIRGERLAIAAGTTPCDLAPLPEAPRIAPDLIPVDILNTATIVDDKRPAIDPKKYIDCFTDGKQAKSYKMTIYVDQPIPGTNAQFSPGGSAQYSPQGVNNGMGGVIISSKGDLLNVGHTFVGFEKINTDGTSVKQFMGFYPSDTDPLRSKGVIKDDTNHQYNVSYSSEINKTSFETALLRVLSDSKGTQYILASQISGGKEYNCTDAAIAWMTLAGIKLPNDASRGLFLNTPGDYGQALGKSSGAKKGSSNATGGHGPCTK